MSFDFGDDGEGGLPPQQHGARQGHNAFTFAGGAVSPSRLAPPGSIAAQYKAQRSPVAEDAGGAGSQRVSSSTPKQKQVVWRDASAAETQMAQAERQYAAAAAAQGGAPRRGHHAGAAVGGELDSLLDSDGALQQQQQKRVDDMSEAEKQQYAKDMAVRHRRCVALAGGG